MIKNLQMKNMVHMMGLDSSVQHIILAITDLHVHNEKNAQLNDSGTVDYKHNNMRRINMVS